LKHSSSEKAEPGPVIVPDVGAIKNMVGSTIGPSDWVTIDQDQIDRFGRATGDLQWIHVDVERSRRESPFGQTIAHGYLTISLVPVLLPQLLVVANCSRIVNYGIDKLRLKEPVLAGSRVRISGEIKSVRYLPSGAAGTTLKLRWEVEGKRRPACVADIVYVFYPAEAEPDT